MLILKERSFLRTKTPPPKRAVKKRALVQSLVSYPDRAAAGEKYCEVAGQKRHIKFPSSSALHGKPHIPLPYFHADRAHHNDRKEQRRKLGVEPEDKSHGGYHFHNA